ncbi:MAG: RluA family pseudouridine synthase [Bacilli bacterium]|nr:RluA family pseudouridine synthase [Bacilli bacterium]
MNKKERLNIIYEDKHILVVDKPSGLLTIGTEKEKNNTLYHKVYTYIKKKNQKVFIVHRLDKDTSGLVLFAKSEKVKDLLQNNWDKVVRKYYALSYGNGMQKEGTIKVKLSETKTLLTYVDESNGKLSITNYHKIKTNGKYNLLDIEILTGRKNQIRVSLNHIGYPIIGDKKYGKAPNPLRRLCLHAYLLEFDHPITHEHLRLELPLPKVFNNLME